MTIRPAPTSPILSATNGNFSAEADLFGAEPDIDDPLEMIDADVRPAIDRFARTGSRSTSRSTRRPGKRYSPIVIGMGGDRSVMTSPFEC